jgi:hypothetical protein
VPKIVIATPAYGEIFYSPYVKSLFALQRMFERRQWGSIFSTISYAEIAESRNYLLTHWFDKTDASHILFVDADMGYDAALIAGMVEFDKPVIGTVYPKRRVDMGKIAVSAAKGEPPERAVLKGHEFVFQPQRGKAPRVEKGFMEVEGCGAGILLIQRSCIETMLRVLPDLSDENAAKESPLAKNLDRMIRAFDVLRAAGKRLSEDYSFCHRWRTSCSGEIWASIDHEITHIGVHQFKGRYADAMGAVAPLTIVNAKDAVASGRIGARAAKPAAGE